MFCLPRRSLTLWLQRAEVRPEFHCNNVNNYQSRNKPHVTKCYDTLHMFRWDRSFVNKIIAFCSSILWQNPFPIILRPSPGKAQLDRRADLMVYRLTAGRRETPKCWNVCWCFEDKAQTLPTWVIYHGRCSFRLLTNSLFFFGQHVVI